jgi:Lon protease-like protein
LKLTLDPLPLFPLRTVLFPGGRLPLKIFEARYLDLVSRCLRQRTPFGVVCLQQGGELLPLTLAARQQLMALPDPLQRLALVDDFLRKNRLI